MAKQVFHTGDCVSHGDLVVTLIQLYQVPVSARGSEWMVQEAAVRAVLNEQESRVLEGEVRVEVPG